MARTPKVVENRREQIMDAALRVFAAKGFARASNKDIALEAGITPGLIYHYFPSKEALLQEILQARSAVQTVRSFGPEVWELPPEKLLKLLLLQLLETVESDAFIQLLRIYLSELLHNPKLSSVGIPPIQEGTKYLEDYFRRKIKQGELRKTDPVLATQIILGSLMDMVLRRQILRDPILLAYTHEQIVNATIKLTLQGLLPD